MGLDIISFAYLVSRSLHMHGYVCSYITSCIHRYVGSYIDFMYAWVCRHINKHMYAWELFGQVCTFGEDLVNCTILICMKTDCANRNWTFRKRPKSGQTLFSRCETLFFTYACMCLGTYVDKKTDDVQQVCVFQCMHVCMCLRLICIRTFMGGCK